MSRHDVTSPDGPAQQTFRVDDLPWTKLSADLRVVLNRQWAVGCAESSSLLERLNYRPAGLEVLALPARGRVRLKCQGTGIVCVASANQVDLPPPCQLAGAQPNVRSLPRQYDGRQKHNGQARL